MWTRQPLRSAVTVAVLALLAPAASAAQDRRPVRVRARGPNRARARLARPSRRTRLEIAELQRLFDAYTVMQAQEALQLDDAQFGQFLPKLKALQDTRRRNEVARNQLVAELGRMTAPGNGGLRRSRVKERMRALQDLEVRAPRSCGGPTTASISSWMSGGRRGFACRGRTWSAGSCS